jgi:hypothetical protein
MRKVDEIFNSMIGQGNSAPYIDCDYLESGGGTGAYIDTGVRIGGQGKVEIDDLVLTGTSGNESNWLMGARNGRSNKEFNLRVLNKCFAMRYDGDDFLTGSYTYNKRYRYVRDKNIVTIYDGDEVFYTTTRTLSTNISSYPHCLFAMNNAGNVAIIVAFIKQLGKVRLYDESGVLVRDYSPKIRRADGVAGMYDAVNDVFYTSPNGELFNYGYWT